MTCTTCSSDCCSKKSCVGKLLLRIGVGSIFIYAGYFKLANAEMVAPMFENLFGMAWLGTFVGLVELIGGICMLIGFQTCIAGVLLVIIMITAIFTSHLGQGFVGVQFPMLVMLSAAAIALMGPGTYSVKHCMSKKGSEAPAPVPPQM